VQNTLKTAFIWRSCSQRTVDQAVFPSHQIETRGASMRRHQLHTCKLQNESNHSQTIGEGEPTTARQTWTEKSAVRENPYPPAKPLLLTHHPGDADTKTFVPQKRISTRSIEEEHGILTRQQHDEASLALRQRTKCAGNHHAVTSQ
jgi:hypothetical protein